MRGYLKYLQNQNRCEGIVTTIVSYAPSSETCLQGRDRTIQIWYIVTAKEKEGSR